MRVYARMYARLCVPVCTRPPQIMGGFKGGILPKLTPLPPYTPGPTRAAQMCGKHLGKIAYVELEKIAPALPPAKAAFTILRTPAKAGG